MSPQRFYLIFLLSLTFALLVGALLLWWFPQTYAIEALVGISPKPKTAAFLATPEPPTALELERFQKTQLRLLKSQFVLQSALNRRDISQLVAVSLQEDPVLWLEEEVEVSFPDDHELLELRYEGQQDPEEMKKVVDAVIKAYQNEVVGRTRIREQEQFEDFAKLHRDLGEEIAEKAEKYYTLAATLGPNKTIVIEKMVVADLDEAFPVEEFLTDYLVTKSVDDSERITEFRKNPDQLLEYELASARRTGTPNAELALLQEELSQLKQIHREMELRLRTLRLESQVAGDRFLVHQPASYSKIITAEESSRWAGYGALSTFFVSGIILWGCGLWSRRKSET